LIQINQIIEEREGRSVKAFCEKNRGKNRLVLYVGQAGLGTKYPVLKKVRAAYNIDIDVLAGEDDLAEDKKVKQGEGDMEIDGGRSDSSNGQADGDSSPTSDSVGCPDLLLRIRKAKKWTEQQMADHLVVPLNVVLAMEASECEPDRIVIDRINSLMQETRQYGCIYDSGCSINYDGIRMLIDKAETDGETRNSENPLFWNRLKNRRIKYGDLRYLQKMLRRFKFDRYMFFSWCGVHPIWIIDSYGAQTRLNLKLYVDLLQLEISGHKSIWLLKTKLRQYGAIMLTATPRTRKTK
jgi:transcriptional regulator with XRE-family HTH domain